jgi:hypothetical protein
VPLSKRCCPWGSLESVVYILLLMDVAKLFCRDGTLERSMLDSPLLEVLFSSCSYSSVVPGKAHANPLVGAAAMGSGIPETLLGFGVITGARRGGWEARGPFCLIGDRGEVPLGRDSGCAIPRCC